MNDKNVSNLESLESSIEWKVTPNVYSKWVGNFKIKDNSYCIVRKEIPNPYERKEIAEKAHKIYEQYLPDFVLPTTFRIVETDRGTYFDKIMPLIDTPISLLSIIENDIALNENIIIKLINVFKGYEALCAAGFIPDTGISPKDRLAGNPLRANNIFVNLESEVVFIDSDYILPDTGPLTKVQAIHMRQQCLKAINILKKEIEESSQIFLY